MTVVALPARAKLNLDLRVTGRRSDGLHELRTSMLAIDLHDLLEAEVADETEMQMAGLAVSDRKPNSVIAAHAALERAAGRKLPTRFHLNKRIPPGSGLGGASTDAAAALRLVASLHGLSMDIAPIAALVGADVTFFLKGGAALVEGVGDRLTPQAVTDAWFAIAWPGIELSTGEVYRSWDSVGGEGLNALRLAAAHVDSRIDDFAAYVGRDWRMTGSGSAFFREFPNRAAAAEAAQRLECWTTVAHSMRAWA